MPIESMEKFGAVSGIGEHNLEREVSVLLLSRCQMEPEVASVNHSIWWPLPTKQR